MDLLTIVTQDDGLGKQLKGWLVKAGWRVATTSLPELAKEGFTGDRCAAVFVDVSSANSSASEAVRRVRKEPKLRETPLLLIVGEAQSRLLEAGDVDDFLTLPLSPEQVETRLKFLLRRLGRATMEERVTIGALTIDFAKYEVTLHHEPLDLTYKEFELLKFLVTHPDRVYNREQLLNQVWGYDYLGGTRTVDVHVRRLRAKLGPRHSALIHTIRNVGYKFVPSLEPVSQPRASGRFKPA